jgi:hypothetical protein
MITDEDLEELIGAEVEVFPYEPRLPHLGGGEMKGFIGVIQGFDWSEKSDTMAVDLIQHEIHVSGRKGGTHRWVPMEAIPAIMQLLEEEDE